MNLNVALVCLQAKWYHNLEERGHYIYKTGSNAHVIRSRASKRTRYRWLLLVRPYPNQSLSKSERMEIRRQSNLGKEKKEQTYLVVGFPQWPGRIVVLPADKALKGRHIPSDKGGMAWDC